MKIDKLKSSDTDVIKYVFTTSDMVAEAVLYKYPTYKKRTVICCSTQSSCPMGCIFCGTGDKFIRNLSASEIIQQVYHCIVEAEEEEKQLANYFDRLQIMFMSMGEPFLNYREVAQAIRILHLMFPKAELLVSTSAPKTPKRFEEFLSLSKEIEQVGLQFSVHESTDEARDKLIPFKEKLTLKEIASRGEAWYIATGRTPYLNYCVHAGNSNEKDANNLFVLFDPKIWEVTLSVICEKDETIQSSTERQLELINDFSSKLLSKGYNIRVFNPAGQDDIGGGCGQLFHTQNWIKENII